MIMNQSRLLTSTDLEDEINEYCDAMEDFGQARTGLVAAVAQEYPTYEDPDYMDPAYMVAPIGKAKGKEKAAKVTRKEMAKAARASCTRAWARAQTERSTADSAACATVVGA